MQDRTPIICDRCRQRGYLGEGDFASLAPILDFTPVPREHKRHDGWTPERQRGFIEALAASGSVKQAAKAVNMSSEGAYHLRRHPEAAEFRRAWETALDYGVRVLADNALDRAINGVPVPIMYRGEQVGERRVFNERLTMWTLQHRMRDTFPGAPRVSPGTKAPDTLAREQQALESAEQREIDEEEAHELFWGLMARLFDTALAAGRVLERAAATGDSDAREHIEASLVHITDSIQRGAPKGIDLGTHLLRIYIAIGPYGEDLIEEIERDAPALPGAEGGAREPDES